MAASTHIEKFWRPNFDDSPVVYIESDERLLSIFSPALTTSFLIALDAEWKPILKAERALNPGHPRVSILQVLLLSSSSEKPKIRLFVLDLLTISPQSLKLCLSSVLTSDSIIKLGFNFQSDLINLHSTFEGTVAADCFNEIRPYVDIGKLHRYVQFPDSDSAKTADFKAGGLSGVIQSLLGLPLCKIEQCSNWENRPLTESQLLYAATDVACLLPAFDRLSCLLQEKNSSADQVPESDFTLPGPFPAWGHGWTETVKRFGDQLLLSELLLLPKRNRSKKKKKGSSISDAQVHVSGGDKLEDLTWVGPPPWDPSIGGDGIPKFICDGMIEGLARHLRCVGVDTAFTKNADARRLVEIAQTEKRLILTRDLKLLRRRIVASNLAYRVKSRMKTEQLEEVIAAFDLKITTAKFLSRCIRCNGEFHPTPLGSVQALASAPPTQDMPPCVLKNVTEFWQCSQCQHLYWEGSQFDRAFGHFANICQLEVLPEDEEVKQNDTKKGSDQEVHICGCHTKLKANNKRKMLTLPKRPDSDSKLI